MEAPFATQPCAPLLTNFRPKKTSSKTSPLTLSYPPALSRALRVTTKNCPLATTMDCCEVFSANRNKTVVIQDHCKSG